MKTLTLNAEVFDALEDYSAKAEQLKNFIDFINDFVWNEVSAGKVADDKTANRLTCLTESLADLAHLRDRELQTIIDSMKVSPTAKN